MLKKDAIIFTLEFSLKGKVVKRLRGVALFGEFQFNFNSKKKLFNI